MSFKVGELIQISSKYGIDGRPGALPGLTVCAFGDDKCDNYEGVQIIECGIWVMFLGVVGGLPDYRGPFYRILHGVKVIGIHKDNIVHK